MLDANTTIKFKNGSSIETLPTLSQPTRSSKAKIYPIPNPFQINSDDIISLCEDCLGIQLLECQKQILRRMNEDENEGKYVATPRHYGGMRYDMSVDLARHILFGGNNEG